MPLQRNRPRSNPPAREIRRALPVRRLRPRHRPLAVSVTVMVLPFTKMCSVNHSLSFASCSRPAIHRGSRSCEGSRGSCCSSELQWARPQPHRRVRGIGPPQPCLERPSRRLHREVEQMCGTVAIGRPEPGQRRSPTHRRRPLMFAPLRTFAIPNGKNRQPPPQIVDVPARRRSQRKMMPQPRPQPARPQRAAHVDVESRSQPQ